MYDLLLRGAHVEDPANGLSARRDIAIENGRIAAVAEEISPATAKACLAVEGSAAIPGIIDPHVHVSGVFGTPVGYAMLARAGVCTALNMAGPMQDVLDNAPNACGLNIATLEDATPGTNLGGNDPAAQEVEDFVERTLASGAIGVKMLGGHYPLTPEASERVVRITRRHGGYCAWHAGTTAHGSNIEGMREVFELAGDAFVHLAHINSYCRGMIRDQLEEVMEARQLLEDHPAVVSESYIAAANGTSFTMRDGHLASASTGATLRGLGYENSPAGLSRAMLDGKAFVITRHGDSMVRVTGKEAVQLWEDAGTVIGGSFDVNPPLARAALALSRRRDGSFTVDCLSTDGGSIPRNVLVSQGLGLVGAGMLSLADYVRKTSWNASRCLGLKDKGHLGVGADADITVLDLDRREALATIVGGQVCMIRGHVCGTGIGIITTAQGQAAVRARGLAHVCVDYTTGHLPITRAMPVAGQAVSPEGREIPQNN